MNRELTAPSALSLPQQVDAGGCGERACCVTITNRATLNREDHTVPFATTTIRNQARRRIAAQVRAGAPCCFCRQPIDLSLKYPHPDAFTVDHRLPTSLGGGDEYENGRPSHNHCNRQRSNQPDGTVGRNSGALG